MKAFDSMGQEIVVGSRIAYCVAAGRSQIQNFYEVVEIKTKTDIWNDKEKPLLLAKFIGGHSWGRDKATAKPSRLEFPASRAILSTQWQGMLAEKITHD